MLPSDLFAATNTQARHLGLPTLSRWPTGAGHQRAPIAGIEADSRQVGSGDLFVALRGAAANGHDFLPAAHAQGAAVLLVNQDELREHAPVLEAARASGCEVWVCPDTRALLAPLCHTFFNQPLSQVHLIGITGTNGKTTSTWMTREVLEACGIPTGLIGTLGCLWGSNHLPTANTTPDPLTLCRVVRAMVADGVRVVAMEVSSHALTNARLHGVQFDHVAFTNLTQDHLDYHGTMEAYRQAKWRLFSPAHLKPGALATINQGHPEGRHLLAWLQGTSVALESYGLQDAGATWWADQVEADAQGTRFLLRHKAGQTQWMRSPMPGAFNVENTLVVASLAHRLGISLPQLSQALGAMRPVPGRMAQVHAPGPRPTVFVDYAHTPDALAHVLRTLRPLTAGRVIVVFGCGGDRDPGKRPLMGKLAQQLADEVVVTSDNPRHEDPEAILDQIEAGVSLPDPRWHRRHARAEAIAFALHRASPQDVVLIAGKGHETYQEVAGKRTHFDDMEEAQTCLQTWSTR